MIEVRNLSKFYGEKRAIDALHFTLNKGEIVGLLGVNGAGKTTTIRILTGSLTPSSGEARIDGNSIFDNPIETKKYIGYLPENPPLYEDLSIRDYLVFVSRIKSIPQAELSNEIQRVLERTNLTDVQNKLIYQLSLGYRKRVGIAQAILGKPRVVILDEPISGLDPLQIIEIRNLIRSFSGEHTVLISSHILSEIYKTCDKFLFLHQGKLKKTIDLKSLEKEIQDHSRLLVTFRGSEKEKQIQFLQELLNQSPAAVHSNGEKTEPIELVEESALGLVYRVRPTNESQFKSQLFAKFPERNLELEYIQKEETTLEEIFLGQQV